MKKILGLILTLGVVVGCGSDSETSPTGVSEDSYSETILGTWNDPYGDEAWAFSSDGTMQDKYMEETLSWNITGSTLTLNYESGDMVLTIISMTTTSLTFNDGYEDVTYKKRD
mgnify:FL=1